MVPLLLKLGRSNCSISFQPLLRDDKLYLPDSEVYLVTTKSGKPAIARKKNRDVLRDHGFDLLGQSLGVPSRVDFDRGRHLNAETKRPRSKSTYENPIPRIIEIDTDDEHGILAAKARKTDDYPDRGSSLYPSGSSLRRKGIMRPSKVTLEHEPIEAVPLHPVAKSKRRSRTLSRPLPSERTRFASYESEEDDSPKESTVPVDPVGPFYTPLASPHFHPNNGATPNYPHQTMTGQIPCVAWPGNGYDPALSNVGYNNLESSLAPQQARNRGVQFPNTPGRSLPYSVSMPVMAQGQQMGMPNFSTAQASFFPPPPPLPLGVVPKDQVLTPSPAEPGPLATSEDERIKEHYESLIKAKLSQQNNAQRGNRSVEPRQRQTNEAGDGRNPKNQKNQKKQEQSAIEELLVDGEGNVFDVPIPKSLPKLSIMHTHVCAGCGKTRSKGYHMTHPLKKGETPEPDYCRRCIVNADYTDSEVTDSANGSEFLMVS